MKNKKLKLVPTKLNPYAPPSSLGAAGATQWRQIMSEYKIQDSGGRAVLLQICAAIDDLAECDERIAADGPIILVKDVPREHPLVKRQLALRAFIVRSMQRLGLNLETAKPVGRPPTKSYAGPTVFHDDEEDD
jgi:hypothetical protein